MSEKTRLFRSLLLESLECRTVFSIDGLVAWQFADSYSSFEFDRFPPAQYPHSEGAAHLNNREFDHSHDFQNTFYSGLRASHGMSSHHRRFDDSFEGPSSHAEGEGSLGEVHPAGPGSSSGPPSTSGQVTTQSRDRTVVVVIEERPVSIVTAKPIDVPPAITPRIPLGSNSFESRSLESSGSNRFESRPSNLSGGNNSLDRAPNSGLQNASANPSVVLAGNNATLVSLTNWNSSSSVATGLTSGLPSGTTTFDLSSRSGSLGERSSINSVQRADDFRFARPLPAPSDSLFDQDLVERAAGVESLENLLSGLAENHRRYRGQNGFDAERPRSRNDPHWQPQAAATVEFALADGGMIALALNRDIALSELEEVSEAGHSENKAWIANVGVFRAFENGAVAATEFAGLTNRTVRGEQAKSVAVKLSEEESEESNSQLHPLLASTTAALGAVLLGIRRMRKAAPLMYTVRKR